MKENGSSRNGRTDLNVWLTRLQNSALFANAIACRSSHSPAFYVRYLRTENIIRIGQNPCRTDRCQPNTHGHCFRGCSENYRLKQGPSAASIHQSLVEYEVYCFSSTNSE